MRPMPLETEHLLAWVSPCGGLLDYSARAAVGPPRPVLRRAVPSHAHPGWLAVGVTLGADCPAEARLLDRTPVSARLAVGDGRGGLVIRYELTSDGLLVETAGTAPGSLRVRLDRATPVSAVDPRSGAPEPGRAPGAGELGWDLATPISLVIRPGPFGDH